MNERIQELAERALQLVADEHTNGDESRLNTDSRHVKDLIQAKFAELIVLDCAGVAFSYVVEIASYNAATVVEQNIKQYFGVEE